jgi:hypothetical protein
MSTAESSVRVPGGPRRSVRLPVDGHVHFHNVDCVGATLDSAAANFAAVGAGPRSIQGALLLTQAAGERVFEKLASGPPRGGWQFDRVGAEPETVLARKQGATLAIVCGRQVKSRNGLEVLALGTCREFADGREIEDAIAEVRAAGAMAVVPWGFGKWFGERGRRVRTVLDSSGSSVLAVGDNGGRLAAWGVPKLIRESEIRGFRVLPGTDPFPFGRDYRRVGAFGFVAELELDEAAPWRSLRAWLEASPQSPQRFGSACGPARFVVNQVGMQLYNRFLRKAAS